MNSELLGLVCGRANLHGSGAFVPELPPPTRWKKPTPVPTSHKDMARMRVSLAIKSGRMARGRCLVCGDTPEGHHENYSKPLDVLWLCRTHHRKWEAKSQSIYG